MGPRLDNLVSEPPHEWQQSDDIARSVEETKRRESQPVLCVGQNWTPECPRNDAVQNIGRQFNDQSAHRSRTSQRTVDMCWKTTMGQYVCVAAGGARNLHATCM